MCPTEKQTSEKNGHLWRAGRCWKLGLPSPTIRATRQRRLLRVVALLLLGRKCHLYLCICVFLYLCICINAAGGSLVEEMPQIENCFCGSWKIQFNICLYRFYF